MLAKFRIGMICLIALIGIQRQSTMADTFNYIGLNGLWQTPTSWFAISPIGAPGPPGFGDHANITNGNSVDLAADVLGLTGLTLSGGSHLETNTHQISVANISGTAELNILGNGMMGNNTQMFVMPTGGVGLIANRVHAVNGGELDLESGGVARITHTLSLDSASLLTGDGQIELTNDNDTLATFENDGVIRPDTNDSIQISANLPINLDGNGDGRIDLSNSGSGLTINATLVDRFSGDITMGQDSTLTFQQPWSLSREPAGFGIVPTVTVNASAGFADIEGQTVAIGEHESMIDVQTGIFRLRSDMQFLENSQMHVASGARVEIGKSSFNPGNGTVGSIAGGTWTGDGEIRIETEEMRIEGPTVVNMPNGVFDLDGVLPGNGVVLIQDALQLNVQSVDSHDGIIQDVVSISGFDGQLNVQLTDPSESYALENLELSGPGPGFVANHLVGSPVQLTGNTLVTGNSRSNAPVEILGSVGIGANGAFILNSAGQGNRIGETAQLAGSGRLVVSNGSQLNLHAMAEIQVDVANRGRFEPGFSIGVVTIDANYEQTAAGVFAIELNGTPGSNHDVLHVSGTADIAGEIEVGLLTGFVPTPGDIYTVMTAGTVMGTFDNLLAVSQGVVEFNASVNYLPGQVQIQIGSVQVQGDFDGDLGLTCSDVDSLVAEIVAGDNHPSFDLNGDGMVNHDDLSEWLFGAGNHLVGGGFLPADGNLDGVVDNSDFNIWNGHKFTSGNGWCGGDFNADGVTDTSDFNIWNANKYMSSNVSAVPEPDGQVLILIGTLLGNAIRRRRSK